MRRQIVFPLLLLTVLHQNHIIGMIYSPKLIGTSNTTLQFLVGTIQHHLADMYRHDISGTTTTGSYPTKTTSSSGATSVYDSTYYFMTTAHRIYKVLYNGDQVQTGASNISGSEPTSEQTETFWHDANYYIKFMYSLTTSKKFRTS